MCSGKNLFYLKMLILKKNLTNFITCDKSNKDSKTQFPVDFVQKIISELLIQFQHRFSDLEVKSEEINIFQNPSRF